MIISFIALLLYCTNSYGVESGTVRMQINGGTAWTNINISESYAECESLNSPTSTLGTSALKAHLTTDADWSAMAIFSVSQYGGATDNSPKTTTGNSSGIYNVGSNWTQTTGILSTANKNSTPYVSGLFNDDGSIKKYIKDLVPFHPMGSSPYANGGILLKELKVPSIDKYAVKVDKPGSIEKEDMRVLGEFIRDIIKENPTNYRLFGPDETMSNRLNKVFEVTNRDWYLTKKDNDEYLSVDGRVMDSYLSEHACEGWLEGYLLTGRHGTFASYEAFIRIIDSMASQHAKWLKVCNELSWRKDIASLNYILTSNVWQQDHNGYTHQDPGFIDHLANKKADIVRVYLPPDSNCLLSCYDHIIKTKNYINVIVASKHMRPQWLTMDEAKEHCAKGLGKWEFASNDKKGTDVVLVSIGDAPTLENIAAVKLLREYLPEVKVRFINVVDLMKLQPNTRHPHGLTGEEYNKLFTKDKPIIFNYHGYPTLIHEFTYERENKNVSVHGYMEEGTITTPFDMRVKNEIDRYHIVIDVIKHLDIYKTKKGKEIIKIMKEKLKHHDEYIKEYGIETEEVRNFRWE